jgi:membrane protein
LPFTSLSSRIFKPARRLAALAWSRIMRDGLLDIAASLAFTTCLSLVPLAGVAFWVFSLSPHFIRLELELIEATGRFLPNESATTVAKHITQFAASASGVGLVGLVGLVITSMLMLMSIEDGFDRIWSVHTPRPLLRRLRNYGLLLLIGPLALGIGFMATSHLISLSMRVVAGVPMEIPFAERALLNGISVFSHGLGFALLYYFLPRVPVAARHAIAGGLAAALAFEIAKRGFAFYVLKFPDSTLVYGAFSAVPIFLLWIYVCWLVTLLGALGVALWPLRHRTAEPAPA